MPNILVIEDDVQVRTMLRIMLEEAGYEVQEASDGKEGLSLFRQKHFDLIITDIIMPEKDGMETIIEMRHDYPDVKIIAISGGEFIIPDHYLDTAKVKAMGWKPSNTSSEAIRMATRSLLDGNVEEVYSAQT